MEDSNWLTGLGISLASAILLHGAPREKDSSEGFMAFSACCFAPVVLLMSFREGAERDGHHETAPEPEQ